MRWNDPQLKIAWPMAEDKAILSDKDRALPLFNELFAGRESRAG